MSQLSKTLRATVDSGLVFWCPGCHYAHRVPHGPGAGARWTWNGDVDRPTFTPSVLVRAIRQDMTEDELKDYDKAFETCGYTSKILEDSRFSTVCHSFVTDGKINFLTDCTHKLAGQTVDLPEWPNRRTGDSVCPPL